MKPKKLPYKKFLESFKFAPRPAVNLLIEQNMEISQTSNRRVKFAKLNSRAVLLTKRKKPPFAGSWHLPGSFILKGESLMDCVNRVAKEELGVEIETEIEIENSHIQLVGAFDDIDGDPRGHVVDLVYRCHLATKGLTFKGLTFPVKVKPYLTPIGDTAEVRFFRSLPKNIGFNHSETLTRLGYR